jgi:tetratricopeptide (TPR) repeat protein
MDNPDSRNLCSPLGARAFVVVPVLAIMIPAALAQAPKPKEAEPRPKPAGQRVLQGDDAVRAAELDKAITAGLKAGCWAEAIVRAEELHALRARVQGPKHFETVDEEWRLKTLSQVALMPHEDRVAYESADTMDKQAEALYAQGKYAQEQPLHEKALEIWRRLLTDDHPYTAVSYANLAANLREQGKYALAQPLDEKALEIICRLLTDDHPFTAGIYNNLAINLDEQGKYTQTQPLFEKALEINRILFGEDHLHTAQSYDSLGGNLNAQGKYTQAQPIFEKALEIRHHLLTDDHPRTAQSYNGLATNLNAQGKYTQAQPLNEKALEIRRRLLTDDHPRTAGSYNDLAANLNAQGKYTQAQPIFEKALEIRRRLLTDDHPRTAQSYTNLAANLNAQGKYLEARDRWLSAVKSLDKARLQVAFAGLERVGTGKSPRPALAAVHARLGRPVEAWRALEEEMGRGLLDELAARQDRRLTPAERDRLRELTTALERLDRLAESAPKGLGQAERAKRFEDLKHQRELASIALGEFQTKLVQDHKELAGPVARLGEIQAALPGDTALVAWVDIPPVGPNAADPDGEHWGVVVRSRGVPTWVPIAGTGAHGLWSKDDTELANQVRTELRRRPDEGSTDLRPLIERLRTQRIEPLAAALGAATADGLAAARSLIVLPSRTMTGIPVEALLANHDPRTVSYAPSATVFKYLRERPRPDSRAGLLALGDPDYQRTDRPSDPKPPDHGLLVNVVAPGSNAATRGLRPGDVLLSYNGTALLKREDLKAVPEPGRPVPVELWRGGKVDRLELAPGKLSVELDLRPAPLAIADDRKLRQVLAAARSGAEDLAPLPGTRFEVEALAQLFRSGNRTARVLLGADASEPELDHLAESGELRRFGVIHLATHAVIDDGVPARSAAILTQTRLPDPLQQALNHKPVFDGRVSVREIQRGWDLKAELVTLSACETALGRDAGGEGFVGFTQALLIAGARSVCLSLWKVDDRATALLMTRFYENWLGQRPGLARPLSKAEALQEAKAWLRGLSAADAKGDSNQIARGELETRPGPPPVEGRLFAHPHDWAGFILIGDPN